VAYRALSVLLMIAWVAPQVARGQSEYVGSSTGLDMPESDTGQTELEFVDVNDDGHELISQNSVSA